MSNAPIAPADGYARFFWLWLALRTAIWLAVAVLTLPNAPLDLVEWLAWGHQFAWGYPKHPPLPAWAAALVASLHPGAVWGIYVFSYLLTAICLWTAWRVGRDLLPPREALLAALALDGLTYLSAEPAEFSNNIALNAAWALTVLYFSRAVRTGLTRWWLALGVTVGLGLLCKYTLAVLVAPLAGYLAWHSDGRRHLRRSGPYLAAAIAGLLFAPHALWVVRHDFLTLGYAANRASSAASVPRLSCPALFAVGQLVRLAPLLLILAPLLRRAGGHPAPGRGLLHWAVLGPVALMLGLSAATGQQLRDIWGSPLWTFAGVWLLAVAGADRPRHWRLAVALWALVSCTLVTARVATNVAGPYVLGRPSRAHYPGRALAEEVGRRWAARCDRPFAVVAGEGWRAGNLCCYSPHRPVIYSSGAMGYFVFLPDHSPWTSDADLVARGGVLVWDAAQLGDALPPPARARFPMAEEQPALLLPYQTGAPVPADRVGVAFVWPRGGPS